MGKYSYTYYWLVWSQNIHKRGARELWKGWKETFGTFMMSMPTL